MREILGTEKDVSRVEFFHGRYCGKYIPTSVRGGREEVGKVSHSQAKVKVKKMDKDKDPESALGVSNPLWTFSTKSPCPSMKRHDSKMGSSRDRGAQR